MICIDHDPADCISGPLGPARIERLRRLTPVWQASQWIVHRESVHGVTQALQFQCSLGDAILQRHVTGMQLPIFFLDNAQKT